MSSDSFRPVVIAVVGVTIAFAAALFAYDRFVVAPRDAQRQQEVKVNLAEGRTEAQEIAVDLDASVDRSLERARAGFEDLAIGQDHKRLATEALSRAAMYRVALTEAYMSNGAWPANAREAGLPAFDAGTTGAVQDIVVGDGGSVTVVLREPFAGSRFILAPRAGSDGSVSWSCRSEGDPGLGKLVPECGS